MNKKIMITGPNRGIGLAITKEYLNKGDEVYAFCRNINNSSELQQLSENNKKIKIFQMDVCSEESVKKSSCLMNNYVDLIICNAGIGAGYGGFMDIKNTQEKFLEVLNTNVIGPFLTIKYFLSILKSNDKKIAIISSLMGSQHHDSSNAYFYRASKAAVNNLMVTFSNELFEKNISICSYHPGWVRTEMGGQNADLSPEQSAQYLIERFDELTIDMTGNFYNFDGKKLII